MTKWLTDNVGALFWALGFNCLVAAVWFQVGHGAAACLILGFALSWIMGTFERKGTDEAS